MDKRYNSYGNYLKEKFGCRVHKVSVDVGFTCPNRDGNIARGGCVYCNNSSFTPPYARARLTMREQIEHGAAYLRRRFNAKQFIVYFQAYTNTYDDDVEKLERLYREALAFDGVVGIAIGTRSDCVDEEKIRLFEELAKESYVTLEYGIESIYDKTLAYMNRGHDYQSVVEAIGLTKGRGIDIGAHVIAGFPTETEEETLNMAGEVSNLGVNFLKIHNLHIVRNTPLQRMYAKEPFHLFGFDEYLDFVVRFLERTAPNIIIERLFTDTPKDLLIAPVWNKSHNEILAAIEYELCRRDTYQGKLFKNAAQ
ncbi:MAG: TIGR01212 family radical SAM protein [Deltaproteobacteria bacterium]